VYINNYCDDLAYQKGSISNCITPIQLCCAHRMNIFSSLVNEHFKETNIRTILKETLATLTTMSNIHEVETFFEYFTILFDSKFKFISRKRGEIYLEINANLQVDISDEIDTIDSDEDEATRFLIKEICCAVFARLSLNIKTKRSSSASWHFAPAAEATATSKRGLL